MKSILSNEVYIGNLVQGKFASASYKSHKVIRTAEEEWVRADNTHAPIITLELWNAARSFDGRNHRPKKRKDGTVSVFCGIVHCRECGFKMRSTTQKRQRKDGSFNVRNSFQCGTYSRGGKSACTPHTIGEDVLLDLVTRQIYAHAKTVKLDEQRIIQQVMQQRKTNVVSSKAACVSELGSHRNRIAMLDKLIEQLYEDRFTGVVPETTFKSLIQKYELERTERSQAGTHLENQIEHFNTTQDETHKWIDSIRRFAEYSSTLDSSELLTLIERIEVGERNAETNSQGIRIIYKYVGGVEIG